jgi:uncharacterized membrane protein YhaH (DUF805 family)
MKNNTNRKDEEIWFASMKYGIGWGPPVKWQGWIVLLSYFALILVGIQFIRHSSLFIIPFVVYVFVLTVILLFICWKKGEKPELQWGKKL